MKKQLENESDIVGLMTKILEQLDLLDKKVDSLLNKSLSRPIAAAPVQKPVFQQPVVHAHDPVPGVGRQNDQHKGRPMYPATCADCKKECAIPFKPSGDRPVYCKECFSRRRNGNANKVATDNKPKEMPAVQPIVSVAANIPVSPAKEKKKPAAAKKVVAKKKPVSKKKKK